VVNIGENTVNRIPVVSEEQRTSYGAPTTDVGGGEVAFANDGVQPGDAGHAYEAKYADKKTAAKRPVTKKPAAKAKAKK
jgi:hypothetical protein